MLAMPRAMIPSVPGSNRDPFIGLDGGDGEAGFDLYQFPPAFRPSPSEMAVCVQNLDRRPVRFQQSRAEREDILGVPKIVSRRGVDALGEEEAFTAVALPTGIGCRCSWVIQRPLRSVPRGISSDPGISLREKPGDETPRFCRSFLSEPVTCWRASSQEIGCHRPSPLLPVLFKGVRIRSGS